MPAKKLKERVFFMKVELKIEGKIIAIKAEGTITMQFRDEAPAVALAPVAAVPSVPVAAPVVAPAPAVVPLPAPVVSSVPLPAPVKALSAAENVLFGKF